MSDLLRETLREVLYGPDALSGLFSAPGDGLLRAVHALTPEDLRAAPALAGRILALRHSLEITALRLSDPHALLSDPTDPQVWRPASAQAWRDELVNLARAGQALYDALYRPLSPAAQREAHGAVMHAAREAALIQHWRGLRTS
ncbi:hypothetical protein [Deinococcus radiotolerans]|uniref:Uncharacterized protein n=1 Tax=Deinococcus radiotolerans TaxID=1309407 RepID=A0ABQ2FN85_9DEIO|nr:hypothetical protein [Deinococcus radiotolerans]GGL10716.1 hypothetical protein GCM10010844_31730 [Deinococcus radiotolerans]